ncbi:hypothetical protein ACQKOF_14045 [Lysinibacillus sp. NPDC093190]|uniref:hypothetical protein n=1 Tax=Lysinibacillus sp. NPDC093190 TaxID=3390575 RepID=UPI003D00D48C
MDLKALELSFVFGIIYFFFVISFFFRKRGKIILYSFVAIILLSYAVLLIVRPYIQDAKYNKYTQMVEEHLEEKYSNASWKISVDKDSLSTTSNRYEIQVKFDDEPTVLYGYRVENGKVIQAYVSFENNAYRNGKYLEN